MCPFVCLHVQSGTISQFDQTRERWLTSLCVGMTKDIQQIRACAPSFIRPNQGVCMLLCWMGIHTFWQAWDSHHGTISESMDICSLSVYPFESRHEQSGTISNFWAVLCSSYCVYIAETGTGSEEGSPPTLRPTTPLFAFSAPNWKEQFNATANQSELRSWETLKISLIARQLPIFTLIPSSWEMSLVDNTICLTCWRRAGPISDSRNNTEVEKMACTWFGEICYCCSYTSLPGPAWVV